jgi:excisionase family DNA binding protein
MGSLCTIDQAAAQLACTPAAIRRWLSQGRLARIKVGSLTRVRQADLAAVVAGNGLPPIGSARR